MLSDAEAAEHLWSGDKSVAKRAAAAAAAFALEPQVRHTYLIAAQSMDVVAWPACCPPAGRLA